MDQTTISYSGKAMVVDDVPMVRELLGAILRNLGFADILEAPDGVVAWSLLQREEIALIVTDWNMPNMNGIDLVRKIRADTVLQDIRILMISGEAFGINHKEAIMAGVDGFLDKPFKAAALQEYISRIFSQKEGWRGEEIQLEPFCP